MKMVERTNNTSVSTYLVFTFYPLLNLINGDYDLTLTGKGRISGAVITGGSLKLEEGVTVAYGKAVVTKLVQEYSQWRLVDKSWSDLSAQDQHE